MAITVKPFRETGTGCARCDQLQQHADALAKALKELHKKCFAANYQGALDSMGKQILNAGNAVENYERYHTGSLFGVKIEKFAGPLPKGVLGIMISMPQDPREFDPAKHCVVLKEV